MRKTFLFLLFWITSLISFSQELNSTVQIPWSNQNLQSAIQSFVHCGYTQIDTNVLPVWYRYFDVDHAGYNVAISNRQYHEVELNEDLSKAVRARIGSDVEQSTGLERGVIKLYVEVFPYRYNSFSGQIERLTSFSIKLANTSSRNTVQKQYKKADFATNSVLSAGDWHRFKITSEGVYKISVADLTALNIDPTTVSTSTYQIYGTQGGIIPEIIDAARTDDLGELAIKVVDANSNNRLDGNDHILFYAQGPHRWTYDANLKQYVHQNNFYDNNNYVYLTHSQKNGKRLITRSSGQGEAFDTTITSYSQLVVHEQDLRSFIASGREWFGESFGKQTSQTFSHTFSNIRMGEDAFLRQRFAGRSVQTSSSYSLKVNNKVWYSATINQVGGDYDQDFCAPPSQAAKTFTVDNAKIDLTYTFVKGNSTADAWLDYYELSVPVNMQFGSGQQLVYIKDAQGNNRIKLQMNSANFEIWDVSDYFNGIAQSLYTNADKSEAIIQNDGRRLQLVAFAPDGTKKPEYVGKVQNQNLHAISNVDYVIVTHPDYEDQANRLAELHKSINGYSLVVVRTTDIYHEFGGGKKDATAIRDFLRMIYERGQTSSKTLKYALLFGDGTYDFKDRVDKNTNYIPTFQSTNSYDPSYSHGSDDYFGILDPGEGYFNVSDAKEGLDIGIGRIPCRNRDQARIMIDKITRYHQSTSFGEWRNRLTFLGDDGDGNNHFNDTEQVSAHIDNQNPVYNVNKIYLDAYQQESFGSGEKYPDVNAAIDRNFEKGHFIFNYLGHGGPSGMAHERVVTREQIRNWSNTDKLPVVITATCELTRYDDPSTDSPGELMLFDENGGAIALITTTRLVYINLNRDLNDKVLNANMFDFTNGKPALGDIIRVAKNRTQRNVNQRNFSLIGDPAMILAYPKYDVFTISINDSTIGINQIDTFKAFSKMKINGEVRKPDGSLALDFNGIVYPTMYDKFLDYTTLGNDPESNIATYQMQNSVLYRGKVSVVNGKFSFQFVVPKDIAYQYGQGKLVYYTDNGVVDGNGYEDRITIGGSSSDVAVDKTGPELELFMDDYSFIFGGLTATKPLLLCKVYDENGINTVGNGIGRDITAILDEGTENEQILILNDFYQSTLDSYQEGELRYPMERLEQGNHTMKVRVWDVYNNVSEGYTEFVVTNDADLTLGHVLNYPNPFTTHTDFHFDHNKEGQNIDVQIQVLSISGKVVKTFHHNSTTAGSHFDNISWDGRDTHGDRLGRGVYLYKIKVKSEDGSEAEAVEKLVLLK